MLKRLSIIKKYIEWFCSFSLIPSIFEHVSYMGGGGGGGGVSIRQGAFIIERGF